MLPLVLAAASALAPVPTPIVDGANAFAEDLYALVAKKPGNVVFSPASISTALAMTYAGAQGETAKQMQKALHLPATKVHEGFSALLARLDSNGAGDPELRVANRLFGQKGSPFEAAFLNTVKTSYAAPLEGLDFTKDPEAARGTVNAWVQKQTSDHIKDLFPAQSIKTNARLVLVNAIYFKGKWATAFDKKQTTDDPFTTSAASPKVPTMHLTASFPLTETTDAQVLELPYQFKDKDHSLSMVIVLPKAKDGAATLGTKRLFELLRTPTSWNREAVVSLPRFSATIPLDLNPTLAGLGITEAFDETKANFNGIADKNKMPLFLSRAVHKAFIDVNEVGTEAAAATGVVIAAPTSVAPAPVAFKADHPFVWAIRDKASNAILFVGRVDDPSKTS